ncbi:MAG: hypothetical protein IK024_04245 [Treponema sp.]|nr:hypothetical protein [Treponema sp.]
MRKCIYITSLIFISLVLYTSCAGKIEKEVDELAQKYEELDITNPISKLTKEDYFKALLTHNVEKTRVFLDANYDPNRCVVLIGNWEEYNPLLVVVSNRFSCWDVNTNTRKDLETYDDVELINLLAEYGADVNLLPYIWKRVYVDSNDFIKSRTEHFPEDIAAEKTLCLIEDSNRVIKALLDNGADPNYKGHPAPFDEDNYFYYISMTVKKARRKFKSKKATTPLYEAIKKGMRWESQVDLLLEYGALVDKSCLEAAKLSGDDQMIKKIERIIAAGTKSAI